jgi:protein-L-isoaspartate(D-aspartate) O-methyltransferase
MSLTPDHFQQLRQHMVAEITAETIFVSARIGKAALGERAMAAVGKVPRHEFVPAELQPYAYANVPLPIGCNKTISQPFIVALMTDMLDLQPADNVLEIGTGFGYQAAILAELAKKVYSIDMIEELVDQAKLRLGRQHYRNIEFKVGNGCYGWPEHAPFDKIIVTAAPDLIPGALLQQLKAGGKMIIPTGLADAQQLVLVEKDASGAIATRELIPVRFSQMEGTESQSFHRGS